MKDEKPSAAGAGGCPRCGEPTPEMIAAGAAAIEAQEVSDMDDEGRQGAVISSLEPRDLAAAVWRAMVAVACGACPRHRRTAP